jgi:hypothetical protein
MEREKTMPSMELHIANTAAPPGESLSGYWIMSFEARAILHLPIWDTTPLLPLWCYECRFNENGHIKILTPRLGL